VERRDLFKGALATGLLRAPRVLAQTAPASEVVIEPAVSGRPHKGKVLALVTPHLDDGPFFASGTITKLLNEGYSRVVQKKSPLSGQPSRRNNHGNVSWMEDLFFPAISVSIRRTSSQRIFTVNILLAVKVRWCAWSWSWHNRNLRKKSGERILQSVGGPERKGVVNSAADLLSAKGTGCEKCGARKAGRRTLPDDW
jgi:hypothetical protein